MENTTEDLANIGETALVVHQMDSSQSKPTIDRNDFIVLKDWVKNELFEKVKFLYDQETELKVGGVLHRLFVAKCKDQLYGLKNGPANNEFQKIYMEMLWTEANQKKNNMVANGLTTRRSTVYSSMQNQFVGGGFAMLQLKNNYFAWLLEAKEKLWNLLVTDYDPDSNPDSKRNGMKKVNEAYLKVKLDLQPTEHDAQEEEEGHDLIVSKDQESRYNDLKKKMENVLKKARRLAKNSTKYKKLKKQLELGETSAADDNSVEEEGTQGAQQRKRRKLLKSCREYTVRKKNEGRFKGWSKRAAEDMMAICKRLKEEKEEMKRLCAAYCQVYSTRNKGKGKQNVGGHDEGPPVDYVELWNIGDVEEI